MRLIYKIFLIQLLFVLFTLIAKAQEESRISPNNILHALSNSVDGEGIISIRMPIFLQNNITSNNINTANNPLLNDEANFNSSRGFRVQLYNGNSRNSKDEAYSRANVLKSKFSNKSSYITYKAPFWRLLVGDFRTKNEASAFADELKKSLPQYRREIYVVPSNIKGAGIYNQNANLNEEY